MKELKEFWFKRNKKELCFLDSKQSTLKRCLLLFRSSLLSNFKSHQNIKFLPTNLYILNLPPTMKKDVTANSRNTKLKINKNKLLRLKKFYGYIWDSKLHNSREKLRIMGISEPITETFKKFYSYISYFKLNNYSVSQKQK